MIQIPFYHISKEDRYIEYYKCNNELTLEEVVTYVNIGLDRDFYTHIKQISNPDCMRVLVNKFHQLPSDFIPSDLEVITQEFNESELVLRRSARLAFEVMCQAAKEVGVYLKAVSSFRSYDYQKQVYYSKWTEGELLEDYQKQRDKVSARPGHSEHQTGLAVDINDFEPTFEDTIEGRWLSCYAHHFGFILRYPKGKDKITGYDFEPWHYRYLGHILANEVYHSHLTFDEYFVRYLTLPT